MTVTVVAGSRGITSYETVADAIAAAPFDVTEVVSGGAEDVDALGEEWADEHDVPVAEFPYEDWLDDYPPKRAPLERNKHMAEYADAAVIVWDGESTGTKHMLGEARSRDLEVHLVRTDNETLDEWT